MEPDPSIAEIGIAFARALVAGNYQAAYGLLSQPVQWELSADNLKASYEAMISYTNSPPDTIKVGQLFPPGETDGVPDGLGWAFVDIDCLHSPSDCWLECVGVLVAAEGSRHVIREIVWGRP